MTISISRVDAQAFEAAAGDFGFDVAELVEPRFDRPVAEWSTVPVPPYRKHYKDWPGEDDLDDASQVFFVARKCVQPVGRVSIGRHWNNFGLIDNLAVDSAHRHEGIGRALIEACAIWAKAEGLAGLALETQNNNLAACRFYERNGFELGGIDRFLYRGITPDANEIALFWYNQFKY